MLGNAKIAFLKYSNNNCSNFFPLQFRKKAKMDIYYVSDASVILQYSECSGAMAMRSPIYYTARVVPAVGATLALLIKFMFTYSDTAYKP